MGGTVGEGDGCEVGFLVVGAGVGVGSSSRGGEAGVGGKVGEEVGSLVVGEGVDDDPTGQYPYST